MDYQPDSRRQRIEGEGADDEYDEYEELAASQDNSGDTPDTDWPRRRDTPASMAILVACIAVFMLSVGLRAIPEQYLVFSPGNGLIFPGIISHMFAHANTMHLLGNMVVLYFLGRVVEQRYGTSRFLVLYFVSGVCAALAEAAVAPTALLLGASGALAGVMAAFVRHYPRTMLYLYGILPLPAWLFIVLWLGYNLWGAGGGTHLSIAFCAHLGGFFVGMVTSLLLVPPRRPGLLATLLV